MLIRHKVRGGHLSIDVAHDTFAHGSATAPGPDSFGGSIDKEGGYQKVCSSSARLTVQTKNSRIRSMR
jgi:hypothetical protein